MLIGKKTCQLAIDTFGEDSQKKMAVEEMGELLAALNHYRRGKCTIEDVRTEIADVLICAEQLACIYGYDDVARQADSKMIRLEERIRHYKETETEKL